MPACAGHDRPYRKSLHTRLIFQPDVFVAGGGYGRHFIRDFTCHDFTWRPAALRLEEGTAGTGLARSRGVMSQSSSAATPAGSPAVTTALLIAVVGAAAILGAFYFQYFMKLAPCPLCLEQRIPYYVGISAGAGRRFRGEAASAAMAAWRRICGAGDYLSYRHGARRLSRRHRMEFLAWPDRMLRSLGQIGGSGGLLEQMQATSVVRCDEAAWRLMGVSLAGYNVLISLFLAAQAASCARGLFARNS